MRGAAGIPTHTTARVEGRLLERNHRDQFIGASIGGAIGVLALLAFGEHWPVYAAAVLVSIATCWALNVASASRLVGSTATIILLVPHMGSSPQRMFGSRLFEVGGGVCAAIATVWIAARLPARFSRGNERGA